ncbi:hypothetical protein ASD99_11840 [Mesorhizobium sp. Root695]|uniref:hypothetical protein n=1 Tax=Mesorhizobium sp. Root695 TaxID=1736589 RepID=UPI00070A91CA|nr:hypothetical protein [Mesorhizobium sp. Root695]KRB14919.1 hypothetical protein ASD99_11840 [Mesorhizobium sp. Root695]
MSIDPLSEGDQPKRTLRKRRKRPAEDRHDGREAIVSVPSEEKSFRVWFLSNETGISLDQASELVDRIEADGAALMNAARLMKIHSQ